MAKREWRHGWVAGFGLATLLAFGPASAADDIRIGMLSPMTGPTAKFGQAQKNALTIAVEEINAAGGIKALAVIGAFQSGVSMPASAVAERYQVPYVNFGTADGLTERGFKYFFRAHPNDKIKAKALADGLAYLGDKAGAKLKTAVVMAENTDWGKSVSVHQKAGVEANGVKVAMLENYPFASPDLTSMIVKAKAFKPDMVVIDSYLGDALLIARTMSEQDLKPVVFATGGAGGVQPDFLAGAGPLAEGVISAVAWDAAIGKQVPWIGELNAKHIARFGVPFTEDSASYYQAFYVVIDALERAKAPVTPTTLRDAIAATKITDPNNRAMINPSSEISFTDVGEPAHANAYVVQWQKGKLVLLYPTAYADPADKAIWPYPAQ
jgi:branched-chain amino acid transport system substrate-binding protein